MSSAVDFPENDIAELASSLVEDMREMSPNPDYDTDKTQTIAIAQVYATLALAKEVALLRDLFENAEFKEALDAIGQHLYQLRLSR